MFTFNPPRHPKSGLPPVGIVDHLYALARMFECDTVEVDGQTFPAFEWTGTTDVNWDGQESVRDKEGRVTLVDAEDNAWQATMIEVDSVEET